MASVISLGWYRHSRRWRVWRADEVPVAFWAWGSDAPAQNDIDLALNETNARTLFLRAGQIDFEDGSPKRIRPLTGRLPRNIQIHLVYNATRDFLSNFEGINPTDCARSLKEVYDSDSARASRDGAMIAGIQLDFDVPTRLLAKYATLLASLRELLAPGVNLSITGLISWTDSKELSSTLSLVDFWIPQCYGATIPESLTASRSQPISSSRQVAAAMVRARQLKRSFYAGLAAYGYAIHYAANGSLIGVRGDLNPSGIANDSNFDLVNREPFPSIDSKDNKRWRCVYRARSDCVLDGTPIHAGEFMMLDLQTSASLRDSARIVRELGGDSLLGLCIFRLPIRDDPIALTTKEVSRALADAEPVSSFHSEARIVVKDSRVAASDQSLILTILNNGTARSLLGDDAMALTLSVKRGSVKTIRFDGFSSVGSYSGAQELDQNSGNLHVCSLNRATVLRFSAKEWHPGEEATAVIRFNEDVPDKVPVIFEMMCDDGNNVRRESTIDVGKQK